MPSALFTDPRPAARLGNLIRTARVDRGMRQEDLARRSEIATATLRRIERGEGTGPSVFVVIRLLEELDLGVEHLNAVT
ncbi:helix-turn-helix transcriptional regulator [Frigoribacterium sp. CFBP 8754]|nr:helix-turn-helix transcriptional regulator [Frigoribacterium sp. CFBP 8754]MBD8729538.1 helix-turn-helix transcriptional regulator [Frigoribacterium sp. CFBP 13707]QNE43834.1 helix-turn-helix transcriptional regulator [Frigoribacterium sp. NBH87]